MAPAFLKPPFGNRLDSPQIDRGSGSGRPDRNIKEK